MTITVLDDSGTPHNAIKITAHRITRGNGTTSAWTFDDSTTDSTAFNDYDEIEEAGGGSIAVTAAVDGTEYVIVTLGDTVWANFDAGGDNSPYSVGDTFTMANAPGVGTGTVRAAGDDFVGDE
jgi:hypothetical protein